MRQSSPGKLNTGEASGVARTQRMARVYVIEDDASLREILLQALQELLGMEALGFGTVDDALHAWPGQPPDMVLSELRLPGRSGLDLAAELEACGWHGPLVFFSDAIDEYSPHIPHLPRLALLAKPFDLHALLAYISDELANSVPLPSAPAAPFGMFDYVQLSCVGGHTVEINVLGSEEEGDLVGRVVILGGELWSVQDAQGVGSDAFLRLACLPSMHVTCNALLNTTVARNIPCSWDALMLRAATLRDDVHERLARGVDAESPTTEPGQVGPLERPTFAGPPEDSREQVDPTGEAAFSGLHDGAQGGFPMAGEFLDSGPAGWGVAEPPPAEPVRELTLHELVQAANTAEDAGQSEQALAILEQAMVRFPGHPEILLAVLRLKKANEGS